MDTQFLGSNSIQNVQVAYKSKLLSQVRGYETNCKKGKQISRTGEMNLGNGMLWYSVQVG